MPCRAEPRASSPPPGLPSCLLCLCIGTSVYCDDADLERIPLLPPDTTYLYARFNRISAIRAGDFTGLSASRQGEGWAQRWGGLGGYKRRCGTPPASSFLSPTREAEANRPDEQFHRLGGRGCFPPPAQPAGAHPAREQADGAARAAPQHRQAGRPSQQDPQHRAPARSFSGGCWGWQRAPSRAGLPQPQPGWF